jgi:hypothetical protein
MTRTTGLRVGITIGLQHGGETLWNNGIKQNAVFLAEALRNCASVASAFLVNTTGVPVSASLPWDLTRWPTMGFEEAKDQVDVLIELGGQINADQTRYLHERGARLVSYCCGFEYVHAMESILFERPLWGSNIFINQHYDDIWMIPQVADLNAGYFTGLRRRPARVVPFVWDPVFLEQSAGRLANHGRYVPKAGARRLTVMEPNIDVVKFCLYPTFIAEEAWRVRPEAIQILQVTNSERLALHNAEFIALMNQLDIVRAGKAIFLGRHETPVFLAENTDIVVSHQWENALNYFYLEVCWQGYPLVHNAHLCPDLGYYYAANDVRAGCAALVDAIDNHDSRCVDYMDHQRALIDRYRPGNAQVSARYDALLQELMQREPA